MKKEASVKERTNIQDDGIKIRNESTRWKKKTNAPIKFVCYPI